MGSLEHLTIALTVLVASGMRSYAEAAAMPDEQGNNLAAGGPSVSSPFGHNVRKRAVPLPSASNVSITPATEAQMDAEESPVMVTAEADTSASMSPTDGNTNSSEEQDTTPIGSTGPEGTQTPPGATGVPQMSSSTSEMPSEAPETSGPTIVTTEAPPAVTSIDENSTTQAAETPGGTPTPTIVQGANFTTSMPTTAKPETKTPFMTETVTQTTHADTTPGLPVSSSSPLTEVPTTPPTEVPTTTPVQVPTTPPVMVPTTPPIQVPTTPPVQVSTTPPVEVSTTPPVPVPTTPPVQVPTTPPVQVPTTPPPALTTTPPTTSPTIPPTQSPPTLTTQSPTTPPTQRPSTPTTQSPPLPSTQTPTSFPTQRPSSRYPNLPYMPNPMRLPMGLDDFMGRIGVTKTSSRPANLPSLPRPVSPMPLL
ncbi:mucin-2 isoform X3 [Rhipicephalus sanguineus]|uniref:mucin-2 isoform X3 n=1 Tax=Rhipicephalus sanguineus TaxID=34632 RepID=UPI0020C4ED92|nr:mucin-2 isoform X3 [Rhipicephalus sanguineus]